MCVTATTAESRPMDTFMGALKTPAAEPLALDRPRIRRRLEARERRAEALAAAAFLAVAVLMAFLFESTRELDAGMAATLVLAYALVRQVRFDVGAGFAVPTHLVFVPMLFLLPADALPLLVAAGSLLGTAARRPRAPRASGARARRRGQRLVRGRAGARLRARAARRSRRVVVCVLAFAAQLAADLAASTTREWLCSAIPPHFQARVIG